MRGSVATVLCLAGSDLRSVACMRGTGRAASAGVVCTDASAATTAPRSSARARAGRTNVRWINGGSLEAVLEPRNEGALRERVEEEVLPVEQVVHAERRVPVLIHLIVRLGVHHEPLGEALIRIVAHVDVVERRVEPGAVAAREADGE